MEDGQSSMRYKDEKIDGCYLAEPIITTSLGRSFAKTVDGRYWTRRDFNRVNKDWEEHEFAGLHFPSLRVAEAVGHGHQTQTPKCELCVIKDEYGNENDDGLLGLHLVIMSQFGGNLQHWGLSIGRDTCKGEMLQIPPECLHMPYAFRGTGIKLFSDPNYRVVRIYTMASILTPEEALSIRKVAQRIVPADQASTKGSEINCQTWCIDVLRQLHHCQMITEAKLIEAQALQNVSFSCLWDSEGRTDTRTEEYICITSDGSQIDIRV